MLGFMQALYHKHY